MNILYLCNYYHRAMVFRDAMDCLEAHGNRVIAFNAVVKGATIDEKYRAIMDDKVIHRECFRPWDRYNYFGKQKKIMNAMIQSINIAQFDVIHSHTLFNGGWAAKQLYKRYRIPYVVTVRNTDINDYLKYPIFIPIARRIAEDAAQILFLSATYRDTFLRICYSEAKRRKLVEHKLNVIPNGLEEYWIKNIGEPRQWSEQKCVELICVGKIDYNKNMKTVLDTMKVLQARGIPSKFTVIGQVVDEDVYTQLQQNPDVRLIPYQAKEKLIDYYRDSDVFVMPSFTESFGRVYAEAMTQGLPVIYTRKQGFDGNFPEGEVGFSVDPNNPKEIADAIEKVIKNYNEISINCLRDCQRFDWKIITVHLEEMYRRAEENTV